VTRPRSELEVEVEVAMTGVGVRVVCTAGPLDRPAVDDLRRTVLAYVRHAAEGSAIVGDLSRSEIVDH
jgi:hypothetical protein